MLLIHMVMFVMISSWYLVFCVDPGDTCGDGDDLFMVLQYLLVGVVAVDTCGDVGHEFLLGTCWLVPMLLIHVVMLTLIFYHGTKWLVSMLLIHVVMLVMIFFLVLDVWYLCY